MKLETEDLRADLNERGVLVHVQDKRHQMDLEFDTKVGEAFKLTIPTPVTQANEVIASHQRLPTVRKINGHGLDLTWVAPLVSQAGQHDVEVCLEIRIEETSLLQRIIVVNRDHQVVAEIHGPTTGGITGIGGRKSSRMLVPNERTAVSDPLHQFFSRELGTPLPELLFRYPGQMPMPWTDIYNPAIGCGAAFAALDDEPRQICLRVTMHPGIGHLRGDTWPDPEEARRLDSYGLTLGWISFPYLQSGQSFASPKYALHFHEGDWHAAARWYRRRFLEGRTIQTAEQSWMRRTGAVQDTVFLLPEGNVQMTFADLPACAAAARAAGVNAVLVSGWDRGGHDGIYPYYEPDERLGSWDDLRTGIEHCHAAGTRVFFFVNLQPVDAGTDWYRSELYKYRSMDPWGVNSVTLRYGMGTVAARMGATSRPLVFASPAFPAFRDLITRQIVRLAEIGADGVHVDKVAWGNVGLDFNPDLPTSPDRATWQGILAFFEETAAACHAVNPDFGFSYEGAWDGLLRHSSVAWAWHSTWDRDHCPAFKYTFPEWFPAFAVTQPYDFNIVNNAVRYGYQMLIAPAQGSSSLAHPAFGSLASYIASVESLRSDLAELLVYGAFTDTLDARVRGGENIRFATHRSDRGGVACVVVNYGTNPDVVHVEELGSAGDVIVHRPGAHSQSGRLPMDLELAGERLAVVVSEFVNPCG